MELKVSVEGVVRVVCGLTLDTTCQDVVISLAQAIGQTGRYILILNLRGNERHLVANECPLQQLAQLGQLATEAEFILQRTGSILRDGQDTPPRERRLPLPRPIEAEPIKRRKPHKAFTFNLGTSAHPQETKVNRRVSPSSKDTPAFSVDSRDTQTSKEALFRQILQQKRWLQDLESQVQALERDTWQWEQSRPSAMPPSLSIEEMAEELVELEEQLSANETELIDSTHWEEQLQLELDREQDMHEHLRQILLVVEDHSYQIEELHVHSAHMERDMQLTAHRKSMPPSSWQQNETLQPLRQELHSRRQQGEELEAALSEMEDELQVLELMKQDRRELIEELNKVLRQCNLQQFIQQTGGPNTDQTNHPATDVYLSSAGVQE